MPTDSERNAEAFLNLYRTLEGLLEKRYTGCRLSSSSVVMEYMHEADSAPWRSELDLCREIRNILSHNTDADGEPVVEPSEATLQALRDIIEYVRRPRLAMDYATPLDKIMFAHPNDSAQNVIRHMLRMGYSHVPVRERDGLIGVFSASVLMRFVGASGFAGLDADLRIGDMRSVIAFGEELGHKYKFMPENAMLLEVRETFEKNRERNHRLAAVFITRDGTPQSELLAMLTPWDVLKDTE